MSKSLTLLDKLLDRDVNKRGLPKDEAEAARARITNFKGDGTGEGGADLISKDTDLVIEVSRACGAWWWWDRWQPRYTIWFMVSAPSCTAHASPAPANPQAIPEIPALKDGLFSRLGALLPPPAILGSNTSSISLTRIAGAATQTGDGGASSQRVVGIHFFNPVPQMRLVEIIPALQTSDETLARARAFGSACGKEVTQSRDAPGFIANAILMPMINEAVMLLERGVATKEDIDTTFRLGMGHPMGPLALADLIGLDTCLAIQKVLATENGDTKYRPATLLQRMVDAGWYGKKSGKGFYEYK